MEVQPDIQQRSPDQASSSSQLGLPSFIRIGNAAIRRSEPVGQHCLVRPISTFLRARHRHHPVCPPGLITTASIRTVALPRKRRQSLLCLQPTFGNIQGVLDLSQWI
jgi:hypothetical protein